MPLGTLDGTPPPFFRQGPSALSKLTFFSALALFLMVADARFELAKPLRSAFATVLYPVQWLVMQPVLLTQGGAAYLESLKTSQANEAAARRKLDLQSQRANQVEQLTLDRDKRLQDDYKESVSKMKLAGTPDTKIPSFTEWNEGLKHPATKGAAMERARGEQIIGATKELGRSMNIIASMPITVSGGMFGSKKASTGFFDAPLNTIAGKLTTDAERQYGIAASNVGQALAIIESGGYKPGQTQINAYQDKLRWLPSDSISTKLLTLADLKAQARERTDVVMANPAIPDEQKQLIREVFDKLDKSIPFEPEDIVAAKNKGKSIKEYMQEKSGAAPESVTVGGKSYDRPAGMTDAQWNSYKSAMGIKQ